MIGLMRSTTIPYGLKAASAAFQGTAEEIIGDNIKNVVCIGTRNKIKKLQGQERPKETMTNLSNELVQMNGRSVTGSESKGKIRKLWRSRTAQLLNGHNT